MKTKCIFLIISHNITGGNMGAVHLGGDPMGLEEEGRESAIEISALGDGAQFSNLSGL